MRFGPSAVDAMVAILNSSRKARSPPALKRMTRDPASRRAQSRLWKRSSRAEPRDPARWVRRRRATSMLTKPASKSESPPSRPISTGYRPTGAGAALPEAARSPRCVSAVRRRRPKRPAVFSQRRLALNASMASPGEHWSLENRQHRRLDVVMNEDQDRTRFGNGPKSCQALPHGAERHAGRWIKGVLESKIPKGRLGERIPLSPARTVVKCDCPGISVVRPCHGAQGCYTCCRTRSFLMSNFKGLSV